MAEESSEIFLHRKLAFTAASGDSRGAKFSDKKYSVYCTLHVQLNDVHFPVTPLKFVYSFIPLCVLLVPNIWFKLWHMAF
jgi:hypothetical protein